MLLSHVSGEEVIQKLNEDMTGCIVLVENPILSSPQLRMLVP